MTDVEGPREVFVEIHVDYDDDHPRELRERFAASGIAIDHETLLSRDDRGIKRRIRIRTPDLATWRQAQAILASTRGLNVVSEETTRTAKEP